jgi:hypothetical protein
MTPATTTAVPTARAELRYQRHPDAEAGQG